MILEVFAYGLLEENCHSLVVIAKKGKKIMDRRTFLQSIGVALSGITGLKLLKPAPKPDKFVGSAVDIVWDGGVWVKTPKEYITFTRDDKTYSMTVFLYGFDREGNQYLIDQQTASNQNAWKINHSPTRIQPDGPGLIVCPEVGKSVPLYGQSLKSNHRT